MNVAPTTAQAGWTIKGAYYKYATTLSSTGDIAEMPDSNYLVHFVVSELHKADRNVTGYTTSLQEAEERLKEMETRQVQRSWYQGDINTTPGLGNTPQRGFFNG